MIQGRMLWIAALGLVQVLSILFIIFNRKATTSAIFSVYTYIADDFPALYPIELKKVLMVVEESAHYAIDSPNAHDEWAYTTPAGSPGYVRLGPDYRAFAVAGFHELHCLRLMRSGLGGDHSAMTEGHFRHCLNYLKQYILCTPDLTLEPADVLTRSFEEKRVGSTHVCNDWEGMYAESVRNQDAWFASMNMTSSLE